METVFESLLQWGVLGILAYLYIKGSTEDKEHEREKDLRDREENNVIKNNTEAIKSLNTTVEMLNTSMLSMQKLFNLQRETASKESDRMFNLLENHDDRSEKIFTALKLIEIQSLAHSELTQAKLDAIIRESYDARTANKIKKEMAGKQNEINEIHKEIEAGNGND